MSFGTGGIRMNGYNFTERVRKVLAIAREEAARLHHEYVGTEHMLLGILREGEGVAALVLESLSVELDVLRTEVEETVREGKSARVTGPDLPYTNFAKRALELAMSEARELGQSYVGTEHLLLGLLREAKGIAAQVLEAHGLTVGTVRSKTIQVLVDGGRADRPAVRRVVMEIEYDDGSRTSIACGSIGEAVHLLMSPRAGGTG